MRFPFTFHHFHIGKGCLKGRLLRTACIYTKRDLPGPFPHMEDPHLLKVDAIPAALHAIITFPSAEAIPHFLKLCRDIRSGPVRKTMICDYTSQPLKFLIFIFNRRLKPIFTIQVHHHTALVKTMLTLKSRPDYKRKISLPGSCLQNRSIVILKPIISTLPEVSSRLRNHLHFVFCNTSVPESIQDSSSKNFSSYYPFFLFVDCSALPQLSLFPVFWLIPPDAPPNPLCSQSQFLPPALYPSGSHWKIRSAWLPACRLPKYQYHTRYKTGLPFPAKALHNFRNGSLQYTFQGQRVPGSLPPIPAPAPPSL